MYICVYTCMCVHRACAPEGMRDKKTSAIFAVFLSQAPALQRSAQRRPVLHDLDANWRQNIP